MGKGIPLLIRLGVWGSVVSSPSGVWGGVSAASEFCTFWQHFVGSSGGIA